MTTLSDGDLIQVIDYDGEMTADLESWMRQQGLDDLGFGYNVITILGSQSSGKSTLMNALFGCTFQVMDAQRGYSQTTKGLWAGRDHLPKTNSGNSSSSSSSSRESSSSGSVVPLERPVLILDVEGLDSLRDWAPTIVPEDVMKEKIIKDYVNKIWDEIEKPAAAAHASAADFFTVEVMGLAHKLLAPQQFEEDVIRLRTRWAKEFSPKSYTRAIPADGFGAYAKNIWETIKQQSHLDIPNQKEMLAIYRCQDLKQQALHAAATRVAALEKQRLKAAADAADAAAADAAAATDAAAIRSELASIARDAIGV
ncbi:Chromosome II, complete genome, related [Eimeria mitis]|uniref:Chromosome II, complete genome, related n=1 Tax=Eimeria mitis TaxID=44415 RepID=U6K4M7_9EIME|nr:Chromosome II, complete genome, related [Eimeria mitis]CDJ31287.1 Chromosome II, complete genome, related [Eimeria mitis]